MVDTCPWLELLEKKKRIWVIQDVEIIRGSTESIGLSFKEVIFIGNIQRSCVDSRTNHSHGARVLICLADVFYYDL